MKSLTACILYLVFTIHINAQGVEQELDEYMKQAIVSWNIPGAELAIVKDGEVVLSKGYGVANVNTGESVTNKTLFAIASNTKAFVSASIATLVEEGKLDWNDKVVDILPYFKMYDPFVTADFTVTDLLCHRSGLATFSGDVLWYGTKLDRETIIRNASQLEPVSDFRSSYGYQNIMFLAAGEVIEEITGEPWHVYVDKTFLSPLGMKNTLHSVDQLNESTENCVPHNDVNGTNVAIDWVNWDNMGPAGSLISNVDDLSHWIKLQLGKGTLAETEYWSESSSDRMWTVHTPKTLSSWHRNNFPSKHFAGYGLGWDLFDYHGKMVVNHGGGYDGFISQTILVPEENLGFVVLTNNNTYFPYSMMYHILDAYLAPEEAKDWGAYMLDLKKSQEAQAPEKEKEFQATRVLKTSPSLSPEGYAGTYNDPKYGDVMVSFDSKKGLSFQFGPTALFHGTLSHWHYDSFRLTWGEQHMLPKGMMTFVLDANGEVAELKVDCPNPDLDFTELKLMRVKD